MRFTPDLTTREQLRQMLQARQLGRLPSSIPISNESAQVAPPLPTSAPNLTPIPLHSAESKSSSETTDQLNTAERQPISPEAFRQQVAMLQNMDLDQEAKRRYQLAAMLSDRMANKPDTNVNVNALNNWVDSAVSNFGVKSNLSALNREPEDKTTSDFKRNIALSKTAQEMQDSLVKAALSGFLNKEMADKVKKSMLGTTTAVDEKIPSTATTKPDYQGARLQKSLFDTFDTYTKKDREAIRGADQALAGLATGQYSAVELSKSGIAKQAGESGRLTDQDISRVTLDPSAKAYILRYWDKWAAGEPLPEDATAARALILGYKAQQLKAIANAVDMFADERAPQLGIPSEQIKKALVPKYLTPPKSLQDKIAEAIRSTK